MLLRPAVYFRNFADETFIYSECNSENCTVIQNFELIRLCLMCMASTHMSVLKKESSLLASFLSTINSKEIQRQQLQILIINAKATTAATFVAGAFCSKFTP